ncbi:MAG: class I SAM-dependent methyltransferase [Chromatiales bacterium]
MQLNRPEAYETTTELELMERLLPLDGQLVLELGCGGAWTTRQLAERHPSSRFIATEVDQRQHAKNLLLELPNVEFRLEGAEAINLPDDSIDVLWMLKSLHHVPAALMPKAMQEIRRVLKPGGLAWFSEPVYSGPFNALMSLIYDEKTVREQAFAAIRSQVESTAMQLVEERFFQVPGVFESWEQFESRFLRVTHTNLDIDDDRYVEIRSAFMAHMQADGAHFLKPHRLDLLQKPRA